MAQHGAMKFAADVFLILLVDYDTRPDIKASYYLALLIGVLKIKRCIYFFQMTRCALYYYLASYQCIITMGFVHDECI